MEPAQRPSRLFPAGLFDSSRYGFSPVVVTPPGCALVFVAGQLAGDPAADFARQVELAFEHLRTALTAAGASPLTVVKITCLVVDHDQARLEIVSRARRDFFGGEGPASTLIPVPRLAGEGALFEIDAVAMVDLGQTPTTG